MKILVGVTGSVATIKLPLLLAALAPHEIRVVFTEHSKHFCDPASLPPHIQCFSDSDEWSSWQKMGDGVLHIELRKWADMLVVAPLDANTLAKAAHGLADNLLTCVLRAWDMHKPLIFCPAMNTHMWEHPVTSTQIATLQSWGFTCIAPISKILACGDSGVGAMAAVETIAAAVLAHAQSHAQTLAQAQAQAHDAKADEY
eukprot:m.233150 g.233150  ORF g.233150 m.233150 type:complete len:200 (+) comp18999_c0_seq1:164-763(+)